MLNRRMIPVLLILSFAALPAAAHTLSAPAVVVADGAGHFSFEAVLTVSEPVPNGSLYINGNDNTDLGEIWGDGFCIADLAPGDYPWTVEGNLADPANDGSVFYQQTLCDGWLGDVTVTIQAPAVGLDVESWSTLKARYR